MRLGWSIVGFGAALIVGGRIYQIGFRPELTESQAVLSFWYVWVAGLLLLGIGCGITIKSDRNVEP